MQNFLFGIFFLAAAALADPALNGSFDDASSTTGRRSSFCLGNDQWHPDKMTSFPGWNQPLPSDWYSGYLEYELEGQHVHTHYVLVMAEESPEDLPLIYWSNGGPGASSLYGLLTEIGPLWLSEESLKTDEYRATGIPSPRYNPHTWTRLGSILIIDQPAPVGFSYCNNDTTSHSCGGIAWTDELTSLNAYTALQTFYETKFPCLQQKSLYLTGESYAGIYIPTLARRIVQDNNSTLKLEGFAVGDGCLGTHTTMCGNLGSTRGFADYWHLWFMAGHHQIPWSDFRAVMKACSHADQAEFLIGSTPEQRERDDLCKAALTKTKKELGGFFEYALYDECTYSNGLRQKKQYRWKSIMGMEEDFGFGGALNDYPCGGGQVMEEYLKIPEVMEAFHVRSVFFEVDNAEGDFDYTPTEPDLQPFYQEMNGKLKILVYNGDTDPAITSFATQNWTSHLGFDEEQHWRPWTVDNCKQMGGYVTRYKGKFDFLTIRGAGHMVPTYKPAASYVFLKAWLNDDEYPTFDVNCTKPNLEIRMEEEVKEKLGQIPSLSLRANMEAKK
jgi:carboxypeptidase C (cathepsin A)